MTNALVFARQDHTLSIRRCHTQDGPLLFVMGSDRESRAYCFGDLEALLSFQDRLEHFLLDSGWAIVSLPSDELREGDALLLANLAARTDQRIDLHALAPVA